MFRNFNELQSLITILICHNYLQVKRAVVIMSIRFWRIFCLLNFFKVFVKPSPFAFVSTWQIYGSCPRNLFLTDFSDSFLEKVIFRLKTLHSNSALQMRPHECF